MKGAGGRKVKEEKEGKGEPKNVPEGTLSKAMWAKEELAVL
jgi:hypothetical protein